MTDHRYSVTAKCLFTRLLPAVFIVLSFSVAMLISPCRSLAFEPSEEDPLAPEEWSSGPLEPHDITAPAPTIEVPDEKPAAERPAAVEQGAPASALTEAEEEAVPYYGSPEITRGARDRMNVSVTFDGGGYEPAEEAEAILAILKAKGIKATIFLTGMFIEKYPELVRQMVRDGHEIGNHTMDHPHLTDFNQTLKHNTLGNVNRRFIARELKATAELFRAATGVEMAPLWRAPYGEINPEIRQWAFEEGYIHVGWTYDPKSRESLDTLDWVSDRNSRLYRTASQIRDRILNFGRGDGGIGGGIILMHLGTLRKHDRASEVLAETLDGLEKRGYGMVKVSEQLKFTGLIESAVKQKKPAAKGMVTLTAPEPRAAIAPVNFRQ